MMMDLVSAESYILSELERRLPADLFYHGLHHVLDVTSAAMELATEEGITDEATRVILRTAALYHDAGFMKVYKGHEAEGCRIAADVLPGFGYLPDQVSTICRMIMATRIPQSPATLPEQVLCDADLDYLGRDDFEPIASTLYKELAARKMIAGPEEWDHMQVRFLEAHTYWTSAARRKRNAKKALQLQVLKRRLGQ